MPLTNGEVVGIALIRDLVEDQARDMGLLADQLFNDEEDEDQKEVRMASFYLNLAGDFMDKILQRNDKPKEKKKPSTDLVLVKNGNEYMPEENSKPISLETTLDAEMDKKLVDMTPAEIGEGTVLFDPEGEAWVASIFAGDILDLKQGHVTKTHVKPKDLKGWTFDGKSWGNHIEELIVEIISENKDATPGWIIAETVKRENVISHPIQVIKAVNRVFEAA